MPATPTIRLMAALATSFTFACAARVNPPEATGGTSGDDSGGASTAGAGNGAVACEDRPLDACGDDCFTITALRARLEEKCWEPRSAVGCGVTRACGDAAIVAGTDRQDALWLFPTTCMPKGWGEADIPEGSTKWPSCPD